MKLEHILLTTDLSDEALRAFEPVARLAGTVRAKVTLLNVVYDSVAAARAVPLGTPTGLTDIEGEKREAAAALAEQAGTLPADLDVTRRVETGTDVASTVARVAGEVGADLVAIATHGRTGFRRLALGSIAEGVVRHSSVPVLCFPMREAAAPVGPGLGRIVLTTDLSDESMRPFTPTLGLARALGCPVTILHVVPELRAIPHGAPLAPPVPSPELPQEMEKARAAASALRDSLGDDAEGLDLEVEVISHQNPAKGVVEYADEHAAGLIALSTHGRTGFRRLTLGSVAEQVLRLSSVPVLSFHRPGK